MRIQGKRTQRSFKGIKNDKFELNPRKNQREKLEIESNDKTLNSINLPF